MEQGIAGLLSLHPMFEALASEELDALSAATTLGRVRKGESLWHVGEPASSFVLVLDGLVGVCGQHVARQELFLGIAGPGDAVGEADALLGEVRRDRAFAFSNAAAVAKVPRESVAALCERDGARAMRCARALASRQQAANHRLASLTQPSEARIAEMVLALTARFGERLDDGATLVPHRFTRANLAAMVGTTVETAIRTLARWTRDGLLAPSDGTLVVVDVPALARIARVAPEALPQLAALTRLV